MEISEFPVFSNEREKRVEKMKGINEWDKLGGFVGLEGLMSTCFWDN